MGKQEALDVLNDFVEQELCFKTKWCSILVKEGGLDWWWDGERTTQNELDRMEYQDESIAEADFEKVQKIVVPLVAKIVKIGP